MCDLWSIAYQSRQEEENDEIVVLLFYLEVHKQVCKQTLNIAKLCYQ